MAPPPRRPRAAAGALVAAALLGVLAVGAVSVPAHGATLPSTQAAAGRVGTAVNPSLLPGAYDYPVTSTVGTGDFTNVAVNPVTNRIYALTANDHAVSVIDGATDTVVTTVSFGAYTATDIAVNPNTNRVFVLATNYASSSPDTVLSAIDGSTNVITGPRLVVQQFDQRFAIDPSTNTAFVTNEDVAGTVTVVDTVTMTTVGLPIVVGMGPDAIAVDSNDHTVYVVNYGDETVSVINGMTRTVIGSPIAVLPAGVYWDPLNVSIAVDESLHRAFLAVAATRTVTMIDGATRSVIGTPLDLGEPAAGVAVDSSTHSVYVAAYGEFDGHVSIIDGKTNTIVGTSTALGLHPAGIAVNPTTTKVYVANYGSANTGYLSVITPTLAAVFADVTDRNNAFFTYIQWMATAGVSAGTSQPSGKPLYNPALPVSRQAMASFLYKLSGETFIPPTVTTFADVDSSATFFTAIEWMASKGISTGTMQSSGKPLFKPTDAVSRQAMALFLARYAHINVTVTPTVQSFADVPLDAAAAAAVKWMKDTGISTGTAQPSGLPLYKPVDPVSRMAMAAFLYRLAHLAS